MEEEFKRLKERAEAAEARADAEKARADAAIAEKEEVLEELEEKEREIAKYKEEESKRLNIILSEQATQIADIRISQPSDSAPTIGEIFQNKYPLRLHEYRPNLGSAKPKVSSKSSSGTETKDFIKVTAADVVKWNSTSFYQHLQTAESVTVPNPVNESERINLWERLVEQKVNDTIKSNLEGNFPDPVKNLTSENVLTQVMITGVYLTLTYIFEGMLAGTGLKFAVFNEPGGIPSLYSAFKVDFFVEIFNEERHAMILQENKLACKFPDWFQEHERDHLHSYYFQKGLNPKHNSVKQLRTYMAIYQRRYGIITSLNCFTFVRFRDDDVMEISERFWIDGNYPTYGLFEILCRFIIAATNDNLIRRTQFLQDFLSISKRVNSYPGRKKRYNGCRPFGFHSGSSQETLDLGRGGEEDEEELERTEIIVDTAKPSCWADLEDSVRLELTAEEQLKPLGAFPNDAKLLSTSRVGDVYMKEWDDVKIVCKLFYTAITRDEDDEPTTEDLRAELDNEAEAYERLADLQGKQIPRFVRYGPLIDGFIDVLATEYAGEVVDDLTTDQFLQAKDAMMAMHGLGVSHGDLKNRNNILLNPLTQRIVLIDFGFAKFREDFKSSKDWHGATCQDLLDLFALFQRKPGSKRPRMPEVNECATSTSLEDEDDSFNHLDDEDVVSEEGVKRSKLE